MILTNSNMRRIPVTPFLLLLLNFLLLGNVVSIKLPENYDPSIRPNNGAVADYIKVSIQVLSIRDINENANELTVDLILRKQWMDSRLSNLTSKDIVLSGKHPEIWVPDLFIRNSAAAKRPEAHSSSVKLTFDGSVNHNERLSVRLSCPMGFAKFPFDNHACPLTLSSYGYTKVHLDMIWHGLVNDDISVFDSEFILSDVQQSARNLRVKEGEYAHLTLTLFLSRSGLRVVFTAFFPTLILTLFSYATLYMQEPRGDRRFAGNTNNLNLVSLGLNSLMVLLVVIIGQINALHTPTTSTITGFDIWMLSTALIIFLSFSLRFLKVVLTWDANNLRSQAQRETSLAELTEKSNPPETWLERVERYLRVCLPIIFIIFLIIYFAVYLS